MDQGTFNVKKAIAPSPSDNLTNKQTIDDDTKNLPIYRETPNLEKFVKYKTADGQTIYVQREADPRNHKIEKRSPSTKNKKQPLYNLINF